MNKEDDPGYAMHKLSAVFCQFWIVLEGPVLIVAKSTDDLTKAPSLENSAPWRMYFHGQICRKNSCHASCCAVW